MNMPPPIPFTRWLVSLPYARIQATTDDMKKTQKPQKNLQVISANDLLSYKYGIVIANILLMYNVVNKVVL